MKRAIAGMLATGTALMALAGAAAAITGPPRRTPVLAPAAGTFSGTITSGSGRYAGDGGRVVIEDGELTRHHSGRLIITGGACRGARHCLALSGTPAGSLIAHAHPIPDAGFTYSVRAAGRVRPLGRVSITGVLQVPGFVACGRQTMTLTLTGARGTVKLAAETRLRCDGPED
jgi:hypothetical protein